jgi:hypothetical protein
MTSLIGYFDNTIGRDLLSLAVGDLIACGVTRNVYEWLPDPSLVLKVEFKERSFCNIGEWETWNRIQGVKEIAKWFAPCHAISACGSMLLQKKIQPIGERKPPERLPVFLADTKLVNYGFFNGRFVCCDYGSLHDPLQYGLWSKKTYKPTWYTHK